MTDETKQNNNLIHASEKSQAISQAASSEKVKQSSMKRRVYNRNHRRKSITRPVGELIPALTRRALGRYGFGQVNLITDWENIVGHNLAQFCRPLKIIFPRGKRMAGTLHIQVMGPMALELQHMQPMLIDRINAYFGYGAIAAIRLKQTANILKPQSERLKEQKNKEKRLPLKKDKVKEIEKVVSNVKDEEMRQLLQKIGESVARRNLATK